VLGRLDQVHEPDDGLLESLTETGVVGKLFEAPDDGLELLELAFAHPARQLGDGLGHAVEMIQHDEPLQPGRSGRGGWRRFAGPVEGRDRCSRPAFRADLVVVLPAPFRPSKPKTIPAGTTKSTPSAARVSPNGLTSPRASIAGGDCELPRSASASCALFVCALSLIYHSSHPARCSG
jgi:hypothetical protein